MEVEAISKSDHQKVIEAIEDHFYDEESFSGKKEIIERTGLTETEVENVLDDFLGAEVFEAYGRQGVASVYITKGMKNAIYTNSKQPDWVKNYEFEKKRKILQELDEKRSSLDRFQKLERLLHGSGDPLEDSLELAFDILGIEYETTEEDEDFRIDHHETKFIIEVKGKGGQLNKGEVNQLDGWDLRSKQVWIGSGGGIDQAQYVPPPPEEIEALLQNMVDYINDPDTDEMPVLIKIAIAHYQFEAIHPFEDGNGRIGRLLVLLNMCDDEISHEEPLLTGPFINLSNYFLRNWQRYYDSLMRVSSDGDYTNPVKFFLRAMVKQSQHAIDTPEKVEDLREEFKNAANQEGVPEVTEKVVDELFRNPIITIPKVEEKFGVSYQTANKAIHELEKRDILEEMEPNSRPKKFICREILDIVYSDFEWSI
ncbi:MAG: Fic family protein [Candidatus Nanohalobium sp.]